MRLSSRSSLVIAFVCVSACTSSAKEKQQSLSTDTPQPSLKFNYCRPNSHETRVIEFSKPQAGKEEKIAELICRDNDTFFELSKSAQGVGAHTQSTHLIKEWGIYPGDVLVVVNSKQINNATDAEKAFAEAETRKENRVLLIRNSATLELDIRDKR